MHARSSIISVTASQIIMLAAPGRKLFMGSSGVRELLRRIYHPSHHQKYARMLQELSMTRRFSVDSLPPVKHASKFKGPLVNQLWDMRLEAKRQAAASGAIDMDRPRPPSESITKIDYDFKGDEFLMERYRNPFGHLRFGNVLEDLDALAGNIAYSHVQDPTVNIVTASVDRIRLSGIVDLENNHQLSGKVTYVGTSSMEIRMQCKGDGDDDPWMEGKCGTSVHHFV